MTISFYEFISRINENPALKVTVLLILGVIFVNGWTDAPNAIATVVTAGGMKLKEAVRMAAVCNFAGLFAMTAFNSKVAFTIYHMVDFGGNPAKALTALCAALTAIIVWAALAWSFGIPTSESHALIAGLSGASIAIHGGMAGINGQEWIKVLYGLFFSAICGYAFGWTGGKISKRAIVKAEKIRNVNRKGVERRLIEAQKAGAAAMAFMHGAQDGQKFMGVFMLGIFLAEKEYVRGSFYIPFWMVALCSLIMAGGTAVGGERIIKTVGNDMVKLKKSEGIAADAAGAFCLLLSTIIGVPVSTTHVKTTAVMGVGRAGNPDGVNMAIVREMITAWIITFPCCGGIGYLAAKIFMIVV